MNEWAMVHFLIHSFLNIWEWDHWDPLVNSLNECLTLKEHSYLCSFESNIFLNIVHFGMNLNFKCNDLHLNIIHFQKGKVFWNHLTEFYQIRAVPDRVWKKGRTLNDSQWFKRGFANTFFYRTHLLWNRLPLLLREVEYPGRFRRELINYIWTEFVSSPEGNDPCGSEMSDEEDVDIWV